MPAPAGSKSSPARCCVVSWAGSAEPSCALNAQVHVHGRACAQGSIWSPSPKTAPQWGPAGPAHFSSEPPLQRACPSGRPILPLPRHWGCGDNWGNVLSNWPRRVTICYLWLQRKLAQKVAAENNTPLSLLCG